MKKLLLVLMMMTILVTTVSACGKKAQKSNSSGNKAEVTAGKETTKNDSTTAEKNKETEKSQSTGGGSVFTEEFHFLQNFEDVMKTFKEFGYVYNTKDEGKEATQWSFEYISLGKETIDGVETEHLKITLIEKGETKESEGWYDTSKWEAVKFKNSKGEKTGLDAAFEGAFLGMNTQLYCNKLLLIGNVIRADGSVDEMLYNMKGKRSAGESIDLGAGTVQIDIYDIEDKFTGYDKVYGLTKLDGKWMYTIIDTVNRKKDTLDGLRVTRAVLR